MPRKGRECATAGLAWPSLASWHSLGNHPQSPVSGRVEGGPVKDPHPEAEDTVSPWHSPGSSILGWGSLNYRLRSLCHLAPGEVGPLSDANCSVSQSCHRQLHCCPASVPGDHETSPGVLSCLLLWLCQPGLSHIVQEPVVNLPRVGEESQH